MKRVRIILILIPALVAGTFYAWLHEPKSLYTFGIHLYLVLGILSLSSAFLAGLLTKIQPEQNMIITTIGILMAVMLNSIIFEINLLHALSREIFIILFFSGHAALIGTYSALFVKNISFKNPVKKIQRQPKPYHQYSVAE